MTHSSSSRRRFLATIGGGLAALTLPACGFQLRGSRPLAFSSIYIRGDANSPLIGALRRQIIANGGTVVVSDPQQAEAHLEILRNLRDREILSLSGDGKVREYTLTRSLGFRLVSRSGEELLRPTIITAHRDYNYNDDLIIAKEEEEDLLYRDMEKDLLDQMLRRLAAVTPLPEKAAEETEDEEQP